MPRLQTDRAGPDAPATVSDPLRSWPLTGREQEFGYVTDLILEGRTVVIAGAPGVGKTRLAREVAERLADRGRPEESLHVEWIIGTAEGIPLTPFAHLLDHLPPSSGGPALSTPLALLRRTLRERSGGRPVLVVADDAHLLDDQSAALLLQLATTMTVLATVRTHHDAPAPVVSLWKEDRGIRLDLQPLTRAETADLLVSALGAPVTASTLDRLLVITRGNTLFLRELVVEGLRSGALRHASGRWSWEGPLRVSDRLSEVVGVHLGRLDDPHRTAAEIVALADPVAWSDLVAVATEDVVADLVERGVLEMVDEAGEPALRPSHPVVAEVLLSRLSPPRRRRLVRIAARSLASSGSLRHRLRRAAWFAELGWEFPIDELIAAARQCAMVAPDMARRLARRVADQGAASMAASVIAQIDMFSGRSDRAEEALAAFDPADLDAEDRTNLTVMRANNLAFGLRRPEAALDLIDELGVRSDWLDGQRVPMLVLAGRLTEARAVADRLLACPTATPADRMRARFGLVPTCALGGWLDEAIAVASAGLAGAAEVAGELPFAVGQLGTGLILTLHWSGRFDEADGFARLAYDQGVADDVPIQRGIGAFHLGVGSFWRGDLEAAEGWLAAAVADLRTADLGFLPSAVDHWRATNALLGRAAHVPEVDRRLPLYEIERLRLEATVAASDGACRQARTLARAAAERSETMSAPTYALFSWVDVARYGDPRAAAAALGRVGPLVGGRMATVLVDAVAALVHDDPSAKLEQSAALEALGLRLYAAEWAAAAATAARDGGRPQSARAATQRAGGLAATCGWPRTPMLGSLAELDLPTLTPREREVARLVASGLSNLEVADRLELSIRTVETHLQRVYTKFGIHCRKQLSEVLR
ncbi:helix-turn-helix transcriptional regulator [Rhabdothermincola sediminis]|uniref:helix-turn-helix transcriptional regulator n=1 Tax=Rhabdothermincola sediminis TaxID=2751370 RepID=UPI001AA08B82|nr:LuxR family transcriptional regulator [Rhabdothermincola sediminis]